MIAKEGSFQDWWYKFKTGYYWGTGYGEWALEYYANILSDPQANWFQKTGAGVGGTFSAMWLPNTYLETYIGLSAAALVPVIGPSDIAKHATKIRRIRGLIRIDRPHRKYRMWHINIGKKKHIPIWLKKKSM